MFAKRILLPAAVAAGVVIVLSDVYDWYMSGRRLGDAVIEPNGSDAVVVLGYGNSGTRANVINRFRVRAGLRTLLPHSTLVLCGGSVHSQTSEATIMADYARHRGYAGKIVLESKSRNTRQNIENAIELIEHADTIAIVSNAPHAEVGRSILWQIRPDLGARLRRAHDHRWGEVLWLKPIAAAIRLKRRA